MTALARDSAFQSCGFYAPALMRIPTPAISTHTSPRGPVVLAEFVQILSARPSPAELVNRACVCCHTAARAIINPAATPPTTVLLSDARLPLLCCMAAQPETSLEFALTNYEFRQQYGPPTGGYDDREYSIILILLDYAQFTLNLQQHGNGGSIQPNPVAYMHMRDKLERSSGLLLDIAFNTFHDDYSARYKAVDVMQTLGVMPKAAAVARRKLPPLRENLSRPWSFF